MEPNALRKFLSELKQYSGGKLPREVDLGLLMSLASEKGMGGEFYRLVFLAKFSSKAHRIMERIGRNGEGFDRMSKEFTSSMKEVSNLINAFAGQALIGEGERIRKIYLTTSVESLVNLLELLSDLSRLKSWMTDHPGKDPLA